jgi:hypothetical protein
MRLKKTGVQQGVFNGPDSINFQLSHLLVGGVADRNGQLIAIGNTNDFDPFTFTSTYFRAFAARFGSRQGGHDCEDDKKEEQSIAAKGAATESADAKAEVLMTEKLVVYPNPVQEELIVGGINNERYDQVMIYTMMGVQLQKQRLSGPTARFNVSSLAEGVYLLVLRSSVTLQEKSIKFIVSR